MTVLRAIVYWYRLFESVCLSCIYFPKCPLGLCNSCMSGQPSICSLVCSIWSYHLNNKVELSSPMENCFKALLVIDVSYILFQEIDFFTTSLNQLKLAQSKYVESQESLTKICPQSKDKEILVPLTSSVSFHVYAVKSLVLH